VIFSKNLFYLNFITGLLQKGMVMCNKTRFVYHKTQFCFADFAAANMQVG
jgi:hypothetical protein